MWSEFADAAQVVGAFAAVIALGFVWGQLRLQTRQRKYDALTELHRQIIAPDTQRAIRSIYSHRPEDLAVPSDPSVLEQIELVLNQYDLIGKRVQRGLIPEHETLETEWSVVMRVHRQLRLFLVEEAQLRPGTPYKPGFEWLVERSTQFKNKNYPAASIEPFRRTFPPSGSE